MRTGKETVALILGGMLVCGIAVAQTPVASSPQPAQASTSKPELALIPQEQQTMQPQPQERMLDSVTVVAGTQPGSRLWRVKKGDHVLQVLATVSPLPSGIQWDSANVEGVIARSQEYIRPPYLGINANVGWIGGLRLLPAALRAQKNPDGKTLQQVLDPALYARWSAAKARYLPRDNGIEKKRPMIAANELYKAALKRSGLGGKAIVQPVIDAGIKKHGLKTVSTALQVKIEDPKQALQELQSSKLDDARCLSETLDSIDKRLPFAIQQANAWSTGDIAALRAMPPRVENACISALSEAEFARRRGISNVAQRLRGNWIAAAEAALAKNASTFATLPVESVVGPGSYLDDLRAKGYEVIEP